MIERGAKGSWTVLRPPLIALHEVPFTEGDAPLWLALVVSTAR